MELLILAGVFFGTLVLVTAGYAYVNRRALAEAEAARARLRAGLDPGGGPISILRDERSSEIPFLNRMLSGRALTYRIGAHSTSDDPTRYRTDEEVESWKKKDPVDRLARHLRTIGAIDDAWEKALDAELTAEIMDAIRAVEDLPAPARESLFDDVYAAIPWHLREQRAVLAGLPPSPKH